MNLYRLDPAELSDPLWRTFRETEIGRGAKVAARARAKRLGRDVTVSKIDGRTMRVEPYRIIDPEGNIRKP